MRWRLVLGLSLLLVGMATPVQAQDEELLPPRRPGLCQRVRDFFHPACTAHKTHHDMGCMSLKAHCVFIFGSCCEFWGEPNRMAGYERPSHGYGYGYGYGYDRNAQNGRCWGCERR